MRKSFLFGSIIGLVAWIILWGIIFGLDPVPIKTNENVRRAFNATCRIQTDVSWGTGVLLNTGYIITAAHVVDQDGNGRVDIWEKDIKLEFFGKKLEVSAEPIFFGHSHNYDFAILLPEIPLKSDIVLGKTKPSYGDKLFTIGMTQGQGPLITSGFESWATKEVTSRASMFVYSGNSGGGIFNDFQNLQGIVSQSAQNREPAPVRVSFIDKNGARHFAYGNALVWHHLSAWCEYVSVKTIREKTKEKGMGFLVDKEEEEVFINFIFIQMFFHIFGVLSCVGWFKEELFS